MKNLVQNVYSAPTIEEVRFCTSFCTLEYRSENLHEVLISASVYMKNLVQNRSLYSTEYSTATIEEVRLCTSFFTLEYLSQNLHEVLISASVGVKKSLKTERSHFKQRV